MAKFIALPRANAAASLLNRAEIAFSPQARMSQIGRFQENRQQAQVMFGAAPKDTPSEVASKLNMAAKPVAHADVLGATTFDGPSEDLAKLQEALPDHDIIEDFALDLMQPVKAGDVTAQSDELDLWHLESTQLARARTAGYGGIGEGVGVAVLDTGIKPVPEIADRIKSAWALDTDGNPHETDMKDTQGHGTHVGGLIAGKTVGVAPGAELMSFVMIPGGFGTFSNFIAAINFIASRPEISVMNMSAGVPGYDPSMRSSIQALLSVGVLPVIAIGNEGPNTSRSPGNYVESLSVGASNKSQKVWSSSGGGNLAPDAMVYPVPNLVAPGEAVTSCVMNGGYQSWNGTSMATPLVSGLAALIIEKHPLIQEPDLRVEILEFADKLPAVPEIRQGSGTAQLPIAIWHSGS